MTPHSVTPSLSHVALDQHGADSVDTADTSASPQPEPQGRDKSTVDDRGHTFTRSPLAQHVSASVTKSRPKETRLRAEWITPLSWASTLSIGTARGTLVTHSGHP